MTNTRTTSNSAAPRHGQVSSEKSHTMSTPSEVLILPPPSVCPTSHLANLYQTNPSKYYTTITPRCHPMHRAESSIAQQSFVTSKPVFFSISPLICQGALLLAASLQNLRDSSLFVFRIPSLFWDTVFLSEGKEIFFSHPKHLLASHILWEPRVFCFIIPLMRF